MFFETHPYGEIFPCRRGQNWQMLLPLFYKYKRFYIDEPLYNYIIYDTSMSQGDNTEEKKIQRCDEHEEIILKTLSSMDMKFEAKEKYISETQIRYTRKKLTIAFLSGNSLLVNKMFFILKKENQPRNKELVYKTIIKNVILYRLFKCLLPIIRKVF